MSSKDESTVPAMRELTESELDNISGGMITEFVNAVARLVATAIVEFGYSKITMPEEVIVVRR